MATFHRFEDLDVWKLGRELTNRIYDLSGTGSFGRDFGLRDQIRRAAVSVMSNIAEGFESQTQAVFIEFLGHSKRSAGEVRSQLYIARDRNYITQEEFQKTKVLAEDCSRQLAGFIAYLASKPNARRVRETETIYDI